MQHSFDWDRFRRRPLVGILRGFAVDQTLAAVEAAVEGGLTTVEVTMNTEGAADQIERLKSAYGRAANIGAGTVCTVEAVQLAIESGASFIVTPVVDAEVVGACRAAQIPAFVGAMTPTEILQAWRLGASLVKVFPADGLGPAYIRNLRGPLPQVPLMPTGGVTIESLAEYHRAGAVAFGIGSPMFDAQRIEAGDWQWVETQVRRFGEAYDASVAANDNPSSGLLQAIDD